MEKDSCIQEATSINSLYQLMKNDVQGMVAGEREKIKARQSFGFLSQDQFCDLFCQFGTYVILLRNQNVKFVIDKNNERMIRQLYFYLTGNFEFEGNLDRGIMLQGKYGCGKTILMETYASLHNHLVKKTGLNVPLLTFTKSISLQSEIMKQPMSDFVRRPLVIDEFGRESKSVQDYGNIYRPLSELLSLRSDTGAITHGTTNFKLETLSSDEFYGKMVGDRLKSMFNFFVLEGESRRT